MSDRVLIECNTCGIVMYAILDPVLKQKVADNPQNYIYNCALHDEKRVAPATGGTT